MSCKGLGLKKLKCVCSDSHSSDSCPSQLTRRGLCGFSPIPAANRPLGNMSNATPPTHHPIRLHGTEPAVCNHPHAQLQGGCWPDPLLPPPPVPPPNPAPPCPASRPPA